MHKLRFTFAPLLALMLMLSPTISMAFEIERFAGTYVGEAEFESDGNTVKRDLSTTFEPTSAGFVLSWESVTYKSDGRSKSKNYTIEFTPTGRDFIFQSAMKKNLFGNPTPLDPLKGDPFVWARFENDMFTVFSLFIDENGDYEVQEFHRTLVDEGLQLLFRRLHNGQSVREIKALLIRQ